MLSTPLIKFKVFKNKKSNWILSENYTSFFLASFSALSKLSDRHYPEKIEMVIKSVTNLISMSFPGGSVVKNPPAMQETRVWSLSREDPLQKEMAIHSSILKACQAPLSIGFSRQEYWNGFPCPPPRGLPNPGVEPTSAASPALQAILYLLSHHGIPRVRHDLATKQQQQQFNKHTKETNKITPNTL